MRTVYTIALILWIIIGSMWAKNSLCGKDVKKPSAAAAAAGAAVKKGDCDTSLLFTDGKFKVSTSENFVFSREKFTLTKEPSADFQMSLTKVADYLNENPGKVVSISGLYNEKEKNSSQEENLGLARAKTIKTYLVREFSINENQILTDGLQSKNPCYNKESRTLNKGAVVTLSSAE